MSSCQTSHVVLEGHPCFDERAHDRVGRVHLPVAPRCNIHCAFCEHRVCANLTMQHPGWTRQVLSPDQALQRIEDLVDSQGETPFVVGIAGPGEPLENEETFETLAAVHRAYPHLMKCVSSNGLRLRERLQQMLSVGITSLTVTVNAVDAAVGEGIYEWVRYEGTTYRGREAAEILIKSQWLGIHAALDAGLAVKVNTVLIPGINDQHVHEIAIRLRQAGVGLMNLMPLLPAGHMRDHRAPTCEELQSARLVCETAVPQFRRCEHCRADIVYMPGEQHYARQTQRRS
jgi:nitrogen fixation protein NifB